MNISFEQLTSTEVGKYLVQNRDVELEVMDKELNDALDNIECQIGELCVLDFGTGSVKSVGLARIVEVDRKKKHQVKMQWLDNIFRAQYIRVHVGKAVTINNSPRSRSAKILQKSVTNNFLMTNNRKHEIITESVHVFGKNKTVNKPKK